MLFQQPAKLGVLRPQESLHVVHTAMIVDREAARQDGTARAATLGPLDPQARHAARISGNPHTFFVSLDADNHADLLRLQEAATPVIGSVRLPPGAIGG